MKRLLLGQSQVYSGPRPKERFARPVVIGAMLTLLALLGSPVPHAGAAFPGRNGRLLLNVRTELPTNDVRVTPGVLMGDYNIFTVPPSGAGIRQETNSPLAEFMAQWSPDGTRIAYMQANPIFLLHSDIYVLDTTTGVSTNVTNSPFVDSFPSWSPDGKRIIFSSDRANPTGAITNPGRPEGDLYVMDADGSNVDRLTSEKGWDMQAQWSPDGTTIVYRSLPNGLVLMRADGSHRRLLVPGDRFPDPGPLGPQWSPDGTRIAFFTGEFQAREGDIWVVNADGTGLRNLTAKSDAANKVPAWSPDGKSIAFISDRDGPFKLYRMRPDGTHIVQLIDLELDADAGVNWARRP